MGFNLGFVEHGGGGGKGEWEGGAVVGIFPECSIHLLKIAYQIVSESVVTLLS